YTATRRKVEDRYDTAVSFRQALEVLAHAKIPDEEDEPAPATQSEPPRTAAAQEELSIARLDELKKRFHELAVLHRSSKQRRTIPGDSRASDSEIPITYEGAAEGEAPPDDFADESTERRDHVPRLSEDDVEGTAPTKPRRPRA
ncbi:MAG: hypothetical protein ACREJX_17885, partial [Polyangiaceae bacterium]